MCLSYYLMGLDLCSGGWQLESSSLTLEVGLPLWSLTAGFWRLLWMPVFFQLSPSPPEHLTSPWMMLAGDLRDGRLSLDPDQGHGRTGGQSDEKKSGLALTSVDLAVVQLQVS